MTVSQSLPGLEAGTYQVSSLQSPDILRLSPSCLNVGMVGLGPI